MPANPLLLPHLTPQREAATLREGVDERRPGRWAPQSHCEGPGSQSWFSESVGMKVGEASGNSSSQVGESNPVLQMKRLPRTGRLLEAYSGRPGDSASELSFLSQM